MKIINLLPKDQQKEISLDLAYKQVFNFWMWVVASLIIFFVLSLLITTHLNRNISKTEASIVENQELLKSSANQQLEAQVVSLNSEIKKINQLRNQHYRWSNGLVELARILPSDMVIDVLFLDRATGKVEITGIASDRASVLQFWSDMHKSEYFKDIDFPLTNLEQSSDATFTFNFFINEEALKQE